MTRIVISLLMCLSTAYSVRASNASTQPNVVFIMADDLGCYLGCYGHPFVKTPNIDKLAGRGVRFDRAYCQYPLCGPSRVSILTGRRPDACKVYINEVPFRWALPDAVTLPQAFRMSGYRTVRIGKIFHAAPNAKPDDRDTDDAPSWDERQPHDAKAIDLENEELEKKYGIKRNWGSGGFNTLSSERPAVETSDGIVTNEALKVLREPREKPLFLAVGYYRPHLPWVTPKEYFDAVAADLITIPDSGKVELARLPEMLRTVPPATDDDARQAIHGYLASVQFLDAQVGRLVDELDRQKMWEDTIVVMLGDHGYQLAQHGLWHKYGLFDPSVRTPLIVAAPGLAGRGKSCSRIVELLDIYPTLIALARLKSPAGLEGRSLLPLLENPALDWNYPAYAMHQPVNRDGKLGRSVWYGPWHYFEWDAGDLIRCLFHLTDDPDEKTNLADDPDHVETLKWMQLLLRREAEAAPPDRTALSAQAKFPPPLDEVRRINGLETKN